MRAGTVHQPIVITQHMPATFTTILGEHISRVSGWEAREAQEGEVVKGGRVYIAPGDFHMVIETKGTDKVLRLNKNPPENFCRPAVDPMLRSIAAAYGKRVLACILTGMGSDGLKGGQAVVASGGTVIAQDEATSVVWGMPGAVATAGVCSAVLPLPDVAPWIMKLAARR
jgi:two-component system chemotaxis response regulator CheB